MQWAQIVSSPFQAMQSLRELRVLLRDPRDEHAEADQDDAANERVRHIGDHGLPRLPEETKTQPLRAQEDGDADRIRARAIPTRQDDRNNEEDKEENDRTVQVIRVQNQDRGDILKPTATP